MRNLLSPEHALALDEAARSPTLVALDFDGTLAPIVRDRRRAELRPETHVLLRLVSLLYPCAVVSGRSRADLIPRLGGIPLFAVVGNHGGEAGHGPVDRSVRVAVVRWREAVAASVGSIAGVDVEDKGLSLAVHYRHARPRRDARRAVSRALAVLEGARIVHGRFVFNLVPAGTHDKGAALSELADRAGCRRVLYVGDDATDEDAFRNARVVTGIRVGRTRRSAARYYIPGQRDLDELLRALVRARRRADGLGESIGGLERLLASELGPMTLSTPRDARRRPCGGDDDARPR